MFSFEKKSKMFCLITVLLYAICASFCLCDVVNTVETSNRDVPPSEPRDCAEVYRGGSTASGIYKISIPNIRGEIKVYCDMSNGGGWTVFQRRVDDSVHFFRSWNKYTKGFGKLDGNHWLGNAFLHEMTNIDPSGSQLRVETISFSGAKRHDEYSHFSIGSKLEKFRLTFDNTDGAADDDGEGLSTNNGNFFTTKNKDNDNFQSNCAKDEYKGGWWYSDSCGYTNLNGPYLNKRENVWGPNIFWYPSDEFYPIKFSEMKFRPMNFTSQ